MWTVKTEVFENMTHIHVTHIEPIGTYVIETVMCYSLSHS